MRKLLGYDLASNIETRQLKYILLIESFNIIVRYSEIIGIFITSKYIWNTFINILVTIKSLKEIDQ